MVNCIFVIPSQAQYYGTTFDGDFLSSFLSSDKVETTQSEQHSEVDSGWEMNNVADENELIDTIINERYLVGDVIAVGRTATVRNGMPFSQPMDLRSNHFYISFALEIVLI